MSVVCKYKSLKDLIIKMHHHVYIPCGPSMMDYPETCGNLRKLAAEVSGRFPDIFINEKKFEKKSILIKISETCQKPLRPVSGGLKKVSG